MPWGKTPDEKLLLAQAEELALSLFGDPRVAKDVAQSAMGGLADQRWQEQQRRRQADAGSRNVQRLRLDDRGLMQRLVLVAAVPLLIVRLDSGDGEIDWFRVFYLCLLVEHALRHNSFEANVAINGFVFDWSGTQILTFHDFLTGSGHSRDDRQVAKRRLQIVGMLTATFQERIQIETSGVQQPAQLVADDIDRQGTADRIDELLAALVPWGGQCDLDAWVGQQALDRSKWPNPSDLYSGLQALSRAEDPRFEVNRFYAVVAPAVHRRLCKMMDFPRTPRVPKLFPAADQATDGQSE